MSKADIELLFGVQGGGSPSGESAQNIKRQLDNIVGNLNKNPFGVAIKLDEGHLKNFQQQLSNLTNFAKSEAAKIQAAYSGIDFPQVPKNTNAGEEARKKQRESVLKQDTTGYYKAITKLEKLQASIRENTRKWSEAEFGESSREYERLVEQLERLDDLRDRLESGSLKIKDFNQEIAQISAIAAESANIIHDNQENVRIMDNLTEGVKGYDQAMVSVNNKLVEVRKNLQAWSAASTGDTALDYQNLRAQLDALEDLQTRLRNGELTAEEFADAFGAIKREVSTSAEAIKKANKAFETGADIKEYNSQLDKVNTLLVKTKKNLAEWTAAKDGKSSGSYRGMEQMVSVLEEMRAELISGGKALDDFDDRFDRAAASTKQFAADIELAGENVTVTGGKISELFKTVGISFTIADVFRKAIEIGREMVDVVTDIDTAVTELKKVTDETEAAYDRFLINAEPRARALGATIADTVSATADFARLGHSMDAASKLADAALVYKNVGDGIEDIDVASKSIISTMQAFGVEAKDAMSIVDSFNAVGKDNCRRKKWLYRLNARDGQDRGKI